MVSRSSAKRLWSRLWKAERFLPHQSLLRHQQPTLSDRQAASVVMSSSFALVFRHLEDVLDRASEHLGDLPRQDQGWIVPALLQVAYRLPPHSNILGKLVLAQVEACPVFLDPRPDHPHSSRALEAENE